jgi:predicted XRE-type DNA-binding protein
VREIRIQQDGQYRVIYVATLAENIYVLHAFQKDTEDSKAGPGNCKAAPEANSEEMIMGVTKSSGNVFKDLGFESGEAENLRLRSKLMRELEKLIRDSGLTQSEAAEFLGIQQSRVSDLVRGKIDRFSIDALVKLLAKAGRDVEIKVKGRAA